MESVSILIKKLKRLGEEDQYPDGANSPTRVTRYRCPCRKGELVEYNTIGFGDHFVQLECERCEEVYHPFVDIVGREFVLYKIS